MFEIRMTLSADPKLETLLDKLCNALDLGNGLPFTAAQVAQPVTTAPAATTTTAARAVPVNPTPVVTTIAPTTAAAPVTTSAPTVATAPLPTVPVTTTVPTAAPAPVMTPPPAAASAVPPQTTVPTAVPTYQIADLARAAATLMDAGKQPQLLALLAQFGVQSLGQLKPEQFGQFATALRGLGAKL